jgi:hypothetical protein
VSSRRDRDHRRRRSQRPDDRDGRLSGEGGCPRRRSSGDPLRLDVQPKPWHNRQDGLGVSEPEAVTRVRRISPGPHPSLSSLSPAPRPTTKRAWTVWKTAQYAVSHTAHTLCGSQEKTPRKRSKTQTARRASSRFTRFQVSANILVCTARQPLSSGEWPWRRQYLRRASRRYRSRWHGRTALASTCCLSSDVRKWWATATHRLAVFAAYRSSFK